MNVFCPRNAFIVAGSNRKREVICHEIVKCLSPNCKKQRDLITAGGHGTKDREITGFLKLLI